jgi:hypothetical protein
MVVVLLLSFCFFIFDGLENLLILPQPLSAAAPSVRGPKATLPEGGGNAKH